MRQLISQPGDGPVERIGHVREQTFNDMPPLARAAFTGFPSPAEDFVEKRIDLNESLVRHKEATFFLRVQGDCMAQFGIGNGDLLVVDRSLSPKHGDVVVAVLEGQLMIKQLLHRDGQCILRAASPKSPDLTISPQADLVIWGVVCWSIHRL